MNDALQRRLIEAGAAVCAEFCLALAGGHALRAHGLIERASENIDLAVTEPLPLPEVAEAVAAAYRGHGFEARVGEPDGDAYAGLTVGDPATGEVCDVNLLKVPLRMRPVRVGRCPVVAYEDAIGLKVGALAGRLVARDLVDVASVAGDYGYERLEWLGGCNAPDFCLERLADRLTCHELMPEAEFERYGLDEAAIRRVKRFAAEWAHDINMRLYEDAAFEKDGTDLDL
ncbi:Nucleotidyl transferase AbiEii toxin, Type IV TA system [Thermomonospora echinospora]|uniref:Nucleotidyl transferase AbiEii toxin, Type IV TA system n=1 Tax=Thermomonospora echinospora TaxID=1992 RepID=A0A1H5VS60_9ACTN|nr:nucleotidyl transferase AbiEii/AbiGii toxin family protein [Thermomonospora echinospora]SEF90165.1 Nucleotidyl transferase AbiEii toxin, Type IV TA system [Thermomonospora echinospora]